MTATPGRRGGLLRRRRTRARKATTTAGPLPAVQDRTEGPAGAAGAAGATAPDAAQAPSALAVPDPAEPSAAAAATDSDSDSGFGFGGTSVTASPSGRREAEPPLPLQVNALQAMCRQVFGFRLAMIALAAPAALLNASPGLGTRLVGAAVVVTFMGSYVLFRDWERFGPLLLRHPVLLAVDTLFGTLLLISAGPDTTLAYVSVCTPLLAGIVYGWRGAAGFASLQSLILLLVHATLERESGASLAERLLLPGFCVITGAVGSTLRGLMLRFGTATLALTTVRARLAVTQAVAAERARLAREMHDSVAKTLHGVALAADGLARSAGAAAMDPERVRQQAELVARAARRAAAESRELLTDLRRETDPDQGVDVLRELALHTRAFADRTGLPVTYHPTGDRTTLPVPPAVARHLLAVTAEAMENAHRHAGPTRVEVRAGVRDGLLDVGVLDDGPGLPPGTDLGRLRRTGHFGLVGMAERAATVGARIRFGDGLHSRGTGVFLRLPLAALTTSTP
ncbi:sensor histidine kinase [Streptomyces sp. NPDC003401]